MIARTDRERRLLRQLEIAARERRHAEDRRQRNAQLRVDAQQDAAEGRQLVRQLHRTIRSKIVHSEDLADCLDQLEAWADRYRAGDPDDGDACQPS